MSMPTQKARDKLLMSDGRFIGDADSVEEFLEEERLRIIVFSASLFEGEPSEDQLADVIVEITRGLVAPWR